MKITRKDFLKSSATAIAACIGLGETRCSDDDAPPAQNLGGSSDSGGSSTTGGSGGTGGGLGSAGAQGSAGTGAGQAGTGGGGTGATGGVDAGLDSASDGSDAKADAAGSPGSAGDAGDAGGVWGNVNVDIETDHPHDLVIPTADIVAGVTKSYRMTGDHDHTVMMHAIDFERLRAGELVETVSSDDDGHTHLVEIRCA